MYKVVKTDALAKWIKAIKDPVATASIYKRIDRVADGNFGDHKSVGEGVSELRIDVGKGYRVFYTIRNQDLVILLTGATKRDQQKNIKLAKKMAKEC